MACLASLVASTLLALHGALHSPALLLMVVRRLRSAHGGGDHCSPSAPASPLAVASRLRSARGQGRIHMGG